MTHAVDAGWSVVRCFSLAVDNPPGVSKIGGSRWSCGNSILCFPIVVSNRRSLQGKAVTDRSVTRTPANSAEFSAEFSLDSMEAPHALSAAFCTVRQVNIYSRLPIDYAANPAADTGPTSADASWWLLRPEQSWFR